MLTIQPNPDELERGLDAWRWLGLDGLEPILVSAFGDVFFENEAGRIQMLDTLEGRLVEIAETRDQLAATLNTPEGRDRLLGAGLIAGATQRRGMQLNEGECFDFAIAPILGAEMSVEAMTTMPLVMKLNVSGQLHRLLKDLPVGTAIERIDVDDAGVLSLVTLGPS